jgi:hypothetical protein
MSAMFPSFPYSSYPTASAGEPITFLVGTLPSTHFSIHAHLLHTSPLFANLFNNPRPIHLPTTPPHIFHQICLWLYENKPPIAEREEDLLTLMKIWVTLGKLGLWRKQNTIMRLGMALMQPQEFVCGLEVVKWVYTHTSLRSKLRDYIIAIFCQRGPNVSREIFTQEIEKLGILKDAVEFLGVLDKVRMGNPKGVEGYDLFGRGRVVYCEENDGGMGRTMATLVTGRERVDWGRVRYPLPTFLVWGEKWDVLPDEHFFVGEADVAVDGAEVSGQLREM